jgi:nucleoside-triphosphatase THEP1
MVLVAVTGPVGSGKTTVLSLLDQWARDNGTAVDGFPAMPHDRVAPQRGAQQYILQQIASGTHLPFAHRDESLFPPYRIDQKALGDGALLCFAERERDCFQLAGKCNMPRIRQLSSCFNG